MNEVLRGGADADTLQGEDGFDTLFGRGGPDSLEGGDDFDYLIGGGGADTLVAGLFDVADNAEFEALIAEAPPLPPIVDQIRSSRAVVELLGPLEQQSQRTQFAGDILNGGAGNDLLVGSNFFDTLIGGNGNDTIQVNFGNNLLVGGVGNDSVIGGLNRDVITGNDGDDTLSGRSASDLISGGAGRDRILGGLNNDTLIGGFGDDTIFAGANNDNVLGGSGNDSIRGELGADGINGGDGNDTIDGGAGRDTISGERSNDVLRGGASNDLVLGGAGDDILFGGNGADTLEGDGALPVDPDGDGVFDINTNVNRGRDIFVLDGNPLVGPGFDLILDFEEDEIIRISRSAFNIPGFAEFEIVDTFSRDVIIFQPNQENNEPTADYFFERASGGIFRNFDGRLSGGGGENLVAQVEGFTDLNRSNFQFIA